MNNWRDRMAEPDRLLRVEEYRCVGACRLWRLSQYSTAWRSEVERLL